MKHNEQFRPTTILLVLMLCIASVYGQSEVTRAYYSTLPFRESPFDDLRGIIPIAAKQAAVRNHYLFEYDSLGRPIKVSFRLGNTLRDPNHTANLFFNSSVIAIRYENDKEIRTFFNRFGQPVSIWGNVFREIYELDNLGFRKRLYFEDKEGKRIENEWKIASYIWDIQKNGIVIEDRFNLKGEQVVMRPILKFFKLRFFYNSHGLLALMQNIDSKGNLVNNETGVAQDKIHYDAQGRWYGWTVMDHVDALKEGNAPRVAKGIIYPNNWGYQSEVRHEDRFGKPMLSANGFWGSVTNYDHFGNIVKRTYLDSIGNPSKHVQLGYTHMRITWDKSGTQQLLTEFLDKEHQPIADVRSGYAMIKQQYDASGHLKSVHFLNEKGLPMNRKDNGIATIVYTWNAEHQQTSMKRFDVNGKEIQ